MATLLQGQQHGPDYLLVGYSVALERVGQNVVDVLNENNVCVNLVEVLEQGAVPSRAEQQ